MPNPSTRIAPAAKSEATATALVEELNYDGRGVARVDGKVVFIDGALPGEQVRFRYDRRRKTYDSGRLVGIVSASHDRVTKPECPYFGTCGGCVLQHMQPDAQIVGKEQVLRDSLLHIGKVQPEHWLPPLRGPLWGYRRKARLGVRLVPQKGGVLVGFRERRRSFITPLADCNTLDPRLARLLPALPNLITSLSCPNRIPQVEVAAGDEEVALVFRHLEPLTPADFARLREFGEGHDVHILLQPGGLDSVRALWPAELRLLAYRLPEHQLRIFFSATDFIQINAVVNRQMVTRALELLDPRPEECVLDLFCGVGNFTLALARRASHVIGIERNPALLERAQHNATHNTLDNIEFRAADLADETVSLPWTAERCDILLMDPPRTGAIQVIKRLPPTGPTRILYISCYPATLARDSQYLVHALGYRLVSACVMDMFPHTSHAESMALFVRS